jgi:hypothetical protein
LLALASLGAIAVPVNPEMTGCCGCCRSSGAGRWWPGRSRATNCSGTRVVELAAALGLLLGSLGNMARDIALLT